MRRYESVIILDPDLPDDDIRAFTDRYTELIKSYGGDIIKVDDWGLKKLAYLVKKREKGRYVFFDYGGVPALIEEMENRADIRAALKARKEKGVPTGRPSCVSTSCRRVLGTLATGRLRRRARGSCRSSLLPRCRLTHKIWTNRLSEPLYIVSR